MNDQWQKKLKKHLVGRTIVKVEWLSPKRTEKLFGWTNQPCEIYLDNGTILTPSADDEGNDAGVMDYWDTIFTNIKEMSVLGVFREEI
jgi:hypothetical protein